MYANKRYHFLQSSLALSTEKAISLVKGSWRVLFAYTCPTSFPFQIVKNSFSGLARWFWWWVEALASKPDDLSPIPWNHTVEGEWLPKVSSDIYMRTHTHTNYSFNTILFQKEKVDWIFFYLFQISQKILNISSLISSLILKSLPLSRTISFPFL